ncbi:hypothetical protein HDE69_001172 [Pedobacter cryoconitis]|uniref:Uncharacterized protein n=1 Tax=Pedobacter cryoconitis TaxID=188932 RepID=A0A7W8YQY2_9SPHI|nr:hypothetical protein [Pedobacter cryoconitis]MBB5620134.1 hypothetical protein [Pedobacter cryoconitis]MBB5649153.1 hypothetical protein [Pedobacter cryoconitis]
MLTDHTELRLEVEKIKKKLDNQDKNMEVVFQYLDELLEKKDDPNTGRIKIQPARKSSLFSVFCCPSVHSAAGETGPKLNKVIHIINAAK